MRFLCFLSVAVFLLVNASLTQAQDWFEIEVIIFEHKAPVLDQGAESAERWPRDLNLDWPSPLLELQPAVERQEPLTILPPFEELVFGQRRMNNDAYALRVRAPYELLWHKAWRAPLLPEERAPWILVQASDELGEHYRLEGAIRIHLSRYLHLSTDLWLTEVSGAAMTEEVLPGSDSENVYPEAVETETPSAPSKFDWSQLPEPVNVRWGCNHIRENWPEDNRLLPADYYEDPAPADWYYPFGCRLLSEQIDKDIPYFVNVMTSDRHAEAELEVNYPELFTQSDPESELSELSTPAAENPGNEVSTPSSNYRIDTQALLDNIEVVYTDEDTSYALDETIEAERIPPAPRVHYPVKEIIHIQGKRRMRSSEFHYIDHPKIGVLAIIHPVEKPELVLEPTEEEISETAN